MRQLGAGATRGEAAPAEWSLNRTGMRPDTRVGFLVLSIRRNSRYLRVCLCDLKHARNPAAKKNSDVHVASRQSGDAEAQRGDSDMHQRDNANAPA